MGRSDDAGRIALATGSHVGTRRAKWRLGSRRAFHALSSKNGMGYNRLRLFWYGDRAVNSVSKPLVGGWADRCRHWLNTPVEKRAPGRLPRRRHEPLVLTGHGMRLNVDNGALVAHSGFTHYPQTAREWRFFPGDPQLPSRIVVLDGSGSLSIGVLDWLAAQKLPLIRIDWRGTVQAVVAGTVLGTDPRKVMAQIEAQRAGRGLAIGATLIRDKIENSIATLEAAVPSSPAKAIAISKLRHDVAELRKKASTVNPRAARCRRTRCDGLFLSLAGCSNSLERNWSPADSASMASHRTPEHRGKAENYQPQRLASGQCDPELRLCRARKSGPGCKSSRRDTIPTSDTCTRPTRIGRDSSLI
jgi:hypothetical protein